VRRRAEPRLGCKLSLAFLFICLFSASFIGIVQKANAEQNVGAPSPGLALYSPTNTTYTSSVVNCSGVLTIQMGEGGGLSYSIDGIPKGSPPWQLNPNHFCGSVYYIGGSFQLPPLPNGSHCLNLTVEDGFSSWVVTVYFTINSSQPIPPTPAPTSKANQTTTPTETQTVPEFTALAILPLFLSLFFVAVIVRHRKTANLRCSFDSYLNLSAISFSLHPLLFQNVVYPFTF